MAKITVKDKSNRPVGRAAKKPRVKSEPTTKTETKQSVVLAMLRRQNGTSIEEIVEATYWRSHSVRGFFAGALKKRLGLEVISQKGEDGVRRYYVAPLKS